jgi:transcription elongation factor GreA
MSKNQLTKEGLQQIQDDLSNLQKKADHLITQIEEVAQPDESGEDSLASQLKVELEVVNSKIASLEEVLENYEIVTTKKTSKTVQIGSKVKTKIVGNGERTFYIVGEFEADPSQNKVSSSSPLGVAMIGKKAKDEFVIDAPGGKVTYKIIAIA